MPSRWAPFGATLEADAPKGHADEFVAAGDFLAYKFPVWQWCVPSHPHRPRDGPGIRLLIPLLRRVYRARGDASRARDYLPADKQYLITRNGAMPLSKGNQRAQVGRADPPLPTARSLRPTTTVPCLRRANALAYTDADEDAERLLSFMDEVRCLLPPCARGCRTA